MAILGIQLNPRVQVGLIVAALVVAGLLAWRALGPAESPIGDTISFVCVATGKTYNIDRDEVESIPLKNPDNGKATLLPCVRRDGKLIVDPHYRGALKDLAEVNQYVDTNTLEVKSAP
ncbi:MAG: hypothetical protein JXB13_13415 [Phycisphaerae bacterium]|nr:hypothetical protein [Phycisphaerae bacterium]